jgi:nucleic acid/nucleotide deaminase of polymorphic system toxin
LAERLRAIVDLIDTMIARLGSASSSVPEMALPPPELSWADRQRARLPAHITSGIYVDEDGNTEIVRSGREADGEHERINGHLVDVGLAPPIGSLEVTKHVEVKVAWRQRNGGVDRVELVVNNEVCSGIRSCERMLPFVLGPGQTLVVHDPVRTREFRGRDAR